MQGPNPHDLDAEDALLGDMLNLPNDVIGDVAQQVVPGDFYRLAAGAAFAALVEAHSNGNPLDPVGLQSVLREVGADPDPTWVAGLLGKGSGAWRHHARTVVAYRARRQLVAAATAALSDAREPGRDPAEVLDRLRAALGGIDMPEGSPPADLHQLDDFIDQPEHEQAPWLLPGLLRRGWRVVLVGGEGRGKSTLWRQFAICAAQGIHPFGFERCDPVRTLLVDLENPPDAIAQGCIPIREQARRHAHYEPGRAWLWHRPQGINLRSRSHQVELAAVLTATRPDVVSLGPLYKAYERGGRETDEQAVAEVQRVFDDLRTRFGFGLLLEHHAPQDSGGIRTMRPYGSSLWLRWPEIGLGMEKDPDHKGSTKLTRWRGDRMYARWPDRLDRSQVWPWAGHWDDDRTVGP